MSGLRTVVNDQGDRLSHYVHDGQPDPLAEALNAGFAERGYVERYQAAQTTAVAEQSPKKLKQVARRRGLELGSVQSTGGEATAEAKDASETERR